jgi:hypothetical protein
MEEGILSKKLKGNSQGLMVEAKGKRIKVISKVNDYFFNITIWA